MEQEDPEMKSKTARIVGILLSLALMLLAALGGVTVWFTALLKGRSA